MARLLAAAAIAAVTGFLSVTAGPAGSIEAGGASHVASLPNLVTVVDSSGRVRSDYSSLAIGADGLPVISYAGNYHLKVLHCGNPACSRGNTVSTVDTQPGVAYSSSIAIGADGLPLIGYGSDPSSAGGYAVRMKHHLKVAHCGDVACSRGNTITTVDKDPAVGYYPSVAIGADGRPVISYHAAGDHPLKVLHCGNPACTSGNTAVAMAHAGGTRSSIAIGADDLPLVVSTGAGYKLRVWHCGNRTCAAGNRTRVVGQPTSKASLAIGRDGLPLIGYPGSGLNVLHCGNSTCGRRNTTTTVDRRPTGGAIAIGPDGRPVLAYFLYGRLLMVLHCGNRACTAGNRGYIAVRRSRIGAVNPSLTIGADALPLVAYVDHARRYLDVLHCGNALCRPAG